MDYSGSEPIADYCQSPTKLSRDERGNINKVWLNHDLDVLGVGEIFWSTSKQAVVRGLHFQPRPYSGRKVVWVSYGRVLDVVVDLRPESPTFMQWTSMELSSDAGAVTIPEQCAHGYLVISECATVHYVQEHAYQPEFETGVLWSSFGFDWGIEEPILSSRDESLPRLDDFVKSGQIPGASE